LSRYCSERTITNGHKLLAPRASTGQAVKTTVLIDVENAVVPTLDGMLDAVADCAAAAGLSVIQAPAATRPR
jgi:hypothetical protein